MKVYLAAPWVDRDRLPELAAQFEAAGHTITERWWDHEDVAGYPGETTAEGDAELGRQALKDMGGVVRADVLVLINSCKSEGKAAETGLALALMKPVIVVGQRSNIFHWLLPEENFVTHVEGALRMLA